MRAVTAATKTMFDTSAFGLSRPIATTLTWAAFTALIVTTSIVAYIWFLVINPQQVLSVKTPMSVLNVGKVVHPGTSLIYDLNYCKYVNTTATMTKELLSVDHRDLIMMLPIAGGSLPMGCHRVKIAEPIPPYVPPGKYILRVTRLYRSGVYYDDPPILDTEIFVVQ